MRPPKPVKPDHLETRGLVWRPSKETLDRLLDSAARPRRQRLSYRKPSLVASVEPTDGNPDRD